MPQAQQSGLPPRTDIAGASVHLPGRDSTGAGHEETAFRSAGVCRLPLARGDPSSTATCWSSRPARCTASRSPDSTPSSWSWSGRPSRSRPSSSRCPPVWWPIPSADGCRSSSAACSSAAGFILWGLVPVFVAILVAQFLWGVGATFQSGATEAWIADELQGHEVGKTYLRGSQLGYAAAALGIGSSALIGSLFGLAVPMVLGRARLPRDRGHARRVHARGPLRAGAAWRAEPGAGDGRHADGRRSEPSGRGPCS